MFLKAPEFAKGLGLTIHIRTKIRYNYSFIESAVIKIGDSILEIAGWGDHILDGIGGVQMPVMMGEDIPVSYFAHKNQKTHIYEIDVSSVSGLPDQRIVIKSFKDWVSINLDRTQAVDFKGSVGMLGEFPSGRMLARDGATTMDQDFNVFGQEWQVLLEDESLFQNTVRAPQHPQQCVLPTPDSTETIRRLSAGMVTEELAIQACAHQSSHQEFCVHDVMATGDLELADAGVY